ncbi:MAG: hypothetical protein FJ304_20605, partial [Planctomycetes bacterium]|nr:hypothetical protein [Planctomycetota bacterium]
SPNDLTRQQLDELDALLQRMLAVPLTDTPLPPLPPPGAPGAALADSPPLPPSWRTDPPLPSSGSSIPHLALVDPPSSPVLKFEPPPALAPKPAPAPVPKPAPVATVAPPPKPAPAPLPPAPKPVAAVAPAPDAPPVPFALLPLVAVNAAFDTACGVFGPLGRVLRSGFFKQLYGLAGLGLIAYTAARVAQVQGWVTLPVTLPWPR